MGHNYMGHNGAGGRDMVDYDANLLAVAFDVAPHDRARAILGRIDAGECAHAFPTYVSEKYYNEHEVGLYGYGLYTWSLCTYGQYSCGLFRVWPI